jgi:hypothetical protein
VAKLGHQAACHLTAEERVRVWAELSAGEAPAEAIESVTQGGGQA